MSFDSTLLALEDACAKDLGSKVPAEVADVVGHYAWSEGLLDGELLADLRWLRDWASKRGHSRLRRAVEDILKG